MRWSVVVLGLLVLAGLSLPVAAPVAAWGNDVYVPGYYRSSGTYVDSYYRTKADGLSFNNYSHSGNINPYTGVAGSKRSLLDSYSYSAGSSYSSGSSGMLTHRHSYGSNDGASSHARTYSHSSLRPDSGSYSSSSSSDYGWPRSWSWSGVGSTARSVFSFTTSARDVLSFRW